MCQAMTPIENGASCTVPSGLSSITCAGERITADENGIPSSKVMVPCACTLDNPIWACQEVVVETRSPSATPLGEVCANLPTPSTGDNCGAVLEEVGLIDRAECMFMQVTTAGSNGQVTSNQAREATPSYTTNSSRKTRQPESRPESSQTLWTPPQQGALGLLVGFG